MATDHSAFDDPVTGAACYRAGPIGGSGGGLEMGEFSFVTTGTTVEVPTRFSKIICANVTSKATMSANETFFCDLTVAAGFVIVERVLNTKFREFHFPIDEGQIASNDIGTTPLMIVQDTMETVQVEFYAGTGVDGASTWVLDMDKPGSANFYISGVGLTEAGGTVDTILAAAMAEATLTDGETVQINTLGGVTSGPADCVLSMQATEAAGTATSALTFNYLFIGMY